MAVQSLIIRDESGGEILGVIPKELMQSVFDAWNERDTCRIAEVVLLRGKIAMESSHVRVLRNGGSLIKASRKGSRFYLLTDGNVLCFIDIGAYCGGAETRAASETSRIARILLKAGYSAHLKMYLLREAHAAVTTTKFTTVPIWKELSATEAKRIYEKLYWQSVDVVARRLYYPTALPLACILFAIAKAQRVLIGAVKRIKKLLGMDFREV